MKTGMILKTNSELGEVSIANGVVAEIAGAVAMKCCGVVGMASRNKKDGIVNLLKSESMSKGINISIEEDGVVVEIHMIAEYGTNINEVCKSIVNNVRYAIENEVGIKVNKVNVRVEGVRVE
jgi:uncharacterized alkaline shock family protein YloU